MMRGQGRPGGPDAPRALTLGFALGVAVAVVGACGGQDAAPTSETPAAAPPPGPQTVVLFATPKFLTDFSDPAPDVARFLDHYRPLTSRAERTIVIFAVGNSQHILQYRGPDRWDDPVEWARYTDGHVPVFHRGMDYRQLRGIVEAFHARAAEKGLALEVYDQIDQGTEFTRTEFKRHRQPACLDREFEHTFDVRGRMREDDYRYASAPEGAEAGTLCGHFLADQAAHYLDDLGFDGILYGNQLGTRGHWLPENGPGYSPDEAAAIRDFLQYSRSVLGQKGLMWFDSYNNLDVERERFSFPPDGYRNFDYLIASGFCVITTTGRYIDNLESKLTLDEPPRVLATLDWVDPWYTYDSMHDFPDESTLLEQIAVNYRNEIDGLVFFANDEVGELVPRRLIESFAGRFFGEP